MMDLLPERAVASKSARSHPGARSGTSLPQQGSHGRRSRRRQACRSHPTQRQTLEPEGAAVRQAGSCVLAVRKTSGTRTRRSRVSVPCKRAAEKTGARREAERKNPRPKNFLPGIRTTPAGCLSLQSHACLVFPVRSAAWRSGRAKREMRSKNPRPKV